MLIPVFASTPNALNKQQEESQRFVYGELGQQGIETRTLGRTDYPTSFPLREVLTLARHCSGGLILGFSQFDTVIGTHKRGTPYRSLASKARPVRYPTPWNQLEAGILFALNVPLLVFRESGVSGGIFDIGTSDLFVHPMPSPNAEHAERKAFRAVIQKWTAQVREHYYRDHRV